MSMHTIYIEVSDEITTVIQRLKNAPERTVALVVPKGAILLQSVVNLKLAKKAAADVNKEFVLVSTDKIGRNLAVQLGIPVVSKEQDAEAALSGNAPAPSPGDDEEPNVIAGVRIHRYYNEDDAPEGAADEPAKPVEPIIIPKAIMKEEAEPEKPAAAEPIVVPPAPEPELQPEVAKETAPVPAPDAPLERSTIDTPVPPVSKTPEIAPEVTAAAVVAATPELTPTPAPAGPMPRNRKALYFSLFLALLLMLGAAALSLVFLPSSHATIHVPAESWTKQLDFTASTGVTSVSEDNKTLPAEIITGQTTDKVDFKATGTKDVGDPAKGTATFYNYDSTNAVTVPAGTKVIASGKSFTTQADISVSGFTKPAGKPPVPGTGTAQVVADVAGDSGNVTNAPANDIHVNGVTLTFNSVSTSGGTSKQVNVVTATDIANAKTTLGNRLRDAAKAAVADQLKNRDPRFNEDADKFTLDNVSLTVSSGDQADGGTVTGTGTLKRTIIDYAVIKTATEARIQADNPATKSITIDKTDLSALTINPDGTQVTFTTTSEGKQSAIVPKETLRTSLAGKSLAAGKALVTSTIPNATLTVTYRPGWWPLKRFPYSPHWLTLDISYE